MDRFLKIVTPLRILAFLDMLLMLYLYYNYTQLPEDRNCLMGEFAIYFLCLLVFVVCLVIDVILWFIFKDYPKRNWLVQFGLLLFSGIVFYLYN